MDEKERELREKLKVIKNNLINLLSNYPETRNDDKYLTILYWKLIDGVKDAYGNPLPFIPMHEIKRATSPETIRRMRQKFNEEGAFLPTDPVVFQKRQAIRERMRRVIKTV